MSVVALGLAASTLSFSIRPVLAAPAVHFIGGADDADNRWENSANWSPGVPNSTDAVVVDISHQGAHIQDGDNETIKSLRLNGGLNVAYGGKLTVSQDITNTGKQGSYFINDGTVIVQDGVDVGTVSNTYDDRGDADPDNDWFGYIANTGKFVANLDNSGSVINGGDGSDPDRVIWLGNVSNDATGFTDNNGGTWRGDVLDNANGIWNERQASWIGNVESNDGNIQNTDGSTWQGNVVGNNGTINNVLGGRWSGDIAGNYGSINNDGGVWKGNVLNDGDVTNAEGTWKGDVLANTGAIYNQLGADWIGDVVSNSDYIENSSGSSWKGDVHANDIDQLINNIDGATWRGDVFSNDGAINNDGGVWYGDVLSNAGGITNSSKSVWNGSFVSTGSLVLAGIVNGSIENDGGLLYVLDPLSGVDALVNTGELNMDDADADDVLRAQSWSGSGTATFDFAPGLGRSDHVVLSGDYTGQTDINLYIVGPSGRAIGDFALVSVGGTDLGDVTVSGLPDNGVVSYGLKQTNTGWVIASSLNDAPAHAAAAAGVIGRTMASATQVPADRGDPCATGGWARGLGSEQGGSLSGTGSHIGMGGGQVGYDLTCIAIPGSNAKLGLGVTAGGARGRLGQNFGGGDTLDGDFTEGFAGLYGNLVAGSLQAALQAQLGIAGVTISDRQSLLEGVGLTSTRLDLSGNASYELALGMISLTPELGFDASNTTSRSSDFADVGGMSIGSGLIFDGHAGATLAAHLLLPDGAMTFTPHLSVSLHDELSSGRALFAPDAGGSAEVPFDGLGSYADIGLGADLVHAPGKGGEGFGAGVNAEFRIGPQVAETSFGGYAQVKF